MAFTQEVICNIHFKYKDIVSSNLISSFKSINHLLQVFVEALKLPPGIGG